ncbi:hypothetical protein D5S19_26560 [Amycolatopsis panacis]|uniref:Uncharacterized protein n=1 Tax=Amycolatopsis panacis TaxID=2340917 RepID=A0A419HRW8_9PSEU|nr:hypothetical protein D5S19_26560 [Amycolatopsis panacis]
MKENPRHNGHAKGRIRRAREIFGFDDRLLARPAAAAVTASFAPEAVKTKLHKEIREWLSPGAAA